MEAIKNEMIDAYNMKEVSLIIDDFLKNKKSSSWIAFDVDYTLTMPALNHSNALLPITKESLVEVFSEIKCETKEEIDRSLSAILFLPQILVDLASPEIIKKLQKRDNTTVFALTACLYKQAVEEIRFYTLNSLGINFQNAFNISEIVFDNVTPYNQNVPKYSNGIIYSNGENGAHNKGTVMRAFIKRIKQVPQVFIIVDDRKQNIEDLQAIFSEYYPETEFFGILYHPNSDFPRVSQKLIADELLKFIPKMTASER
ncbi:MAG: DUF2608 domain-containing protein [Alphaproteobacteria bacterium]|nr:DUF2608 domain-containing protein [Alphaproteobacteria bacterium]